MAGRAIETDESVFALNDDDLYPDVQPWLRDRSANNWNLKGSVWGGIHPQDLDRLQSQKEMKSPIKAVKIRQDTKKTT